jgi:hemoglobin
VGWPAPQFCRYRQRACWSGVPTSRHNFSHQGVVTEMSAELHAQSSIYETIGGEAALEPMVDDFYGRVLVDPELRGFFAGTNMARLRGRQVEFLAAVLGGPRSYTGASLRTAHQGRGIEQVHFDLVAEHLVTALQAAGVPADVIDQIIAVITPLASQIVSSGMS